MLDITVDCIDVMVMGKTVVTTVYSEQNYCYDFVSNIVVNNVLAKLDA